MSSDNPSLSQVTRSKLSSVIGGGAKDSCSLHRWVLLKNSITRSQPNNAATFSPNNTSELLPTYPSDTGDEDEEVCFDLEHDSFIYPDARMLLDSSCSANNDSSESQWFDSLLESLVHEDSDDSLLHVGDEDDEDDLPLSLSVSPMSSTDDLGHPVYNNTPISLPYPVVYPPYNPPLLSLLELQPLNTSLDSIYPPFNVALPYNAEDDIDDLPVPDTVEDLSDDESDALCSPATRSPSMSLVDGSARPSERARRHSVPQVYVNTDGSYFRDGLELDPLPFAHDPPNPSHMFESVYSHDC